MTNRVLTVLEFQDNWFLQEFIVVIASNLFLITVTLTLFCEELLSTYMILFRIIGNYLEIIDLNMYHNWLFVSLTRYDYLVILA